MRLAGRHQLYLVLFAGAVTATITFANHLLAPSPEPLRLTDRDLARYQPSPYEQGQREARADLAAGKLVLKSYGLPAPAFYEYRDILRHEYGIEIDRVAGCIVTPELEEEVRGYEEIMNAAIEARFGANFLEQVWARAEQRLH